MAGVLTTLLLLSLSQFSMWTDADGVVHVIGTEQAPAGAKVLSGDGLSVIDPDGRPVQLADGGTRSQDAAWWQRQFRAARLAVETSRALEAAASRDLREAERPVCVTATAKAGASVRVVSTQRSIVTIAAGGSPPRAVQVGPGTAVLVSDRAEQTEQRCQRGEATGAQRAALQASRAEREESERALRDLEQAALAARVPLRAWY